MAEDNPFADPANINPFADPSVQAAASSAPPTEDYNPFAEQAKQPEPEPIKLPPPPSKADIKDKDKEKKKDKKDKKEKAKPKPKPNAFSEPAIIEPDETPPEYTPAPSSFNNDRKLKKKEEEIARREAALQDRERNMERLGPGERPKNFPPFPELCPSPFKPCFYISVRTEIPPSQHWKMYFLLVLLIYLWILLVINLVVSIAGAIKAGQNGNVFANEYLVTMGIAIAYLIVFIPGSLCCWFMPAYYAMRKDSSLAYMWFFFVMSFQVLSFLLGAIGPPNLGACGWFNGSKLFTSIALDKSVDDGTKAVGAMFIIVGFLWLLGAIPAVLLIILIYRYFRYSGGSINRAVSEGVSTAASNEAVRKTAKQAVKASVKTALTEE